MKNLLLKVYENVIAIAVRCRNKLLHFLLFKTNGICFVRVMSLYQKKIYVPVNEKCNKQLQLGLKMIFKNWVSI